MLIAFVTKKFFIFINNERILMYTHSMFDEVELFLNPSHAVSLFATSYA